MSDKTGGQEETGNSIAMQATSFWTTSFCCSCACERLHADNKNARSRTSDVRVLCCALHTKCSDRVARQQKLGTGGQFGGGPEHASLACAASAAPSAQSFGHHFYMSVIETHLGASEMHVWFPANAHSVSLRHSPGGHEREHTVLRVVSLAPRISAALPRLALDIIPNLLL